MAWFFRDDPPDWLYQRRRFAPLAVTGGVNASLSTTLGALTAAGAITVLEGAALSKTFGPLTVAATATVQENATLDKTLGALQLAATLITLADNAAYSGTLGKLTLAGQITVLNQASLSKTLGALTLSATGTVVTLGAIGMAMSKTLGPLTVSASLGFPVAGAPVLMQIPILQNLENMRRQANAILAALQASAPTYVTALPDPATQPDGRLIVLTTTQKLYQLQNGGWTIVS